MPPPAVQNFPDHRRDLHLAQVGHGSAVKLPREILHDFGVEVVPFQYVQDQRSLPNAAVPRVRVGPGVVAVGLDLRRLAVPQGTKPGCAIWVSTLS